MTRFWPGTLIFLKVFHLSATAIPSYFRSVALQTQFHAPGDLAADTLTPVAEGTHARFDVRGRE